MVSSTKSPAGGKNTSVEDDPAIDVNVDPATYFKKRKDGLVHNYLGRIATELTPNDVFHLISGVTQAINHNQTEGRKFSVISQDTVRPYRSNTKLPSVATPVLYPGRPLIIPWMADIESHCVLAVVRYSDTPGRDHNIKITIIDSKPWRSSIEARHAIYDRICHLVRATQWANTRVSKFMKAAFWAQGVLATEAEEVSQPDYFTVCYSWAVAMDLRLNRNFWPRPNFLADARSLCAILLSERLEDKLQGTWKLIWAFLLSYEFVLPDKVVEPNSQFERLVRRDELEHHPDDLSFPNKWNFEFPTGQRHDVNFPSDKWTVKETEALHKALSKHANFTTAPKVTIAPKPPAITKKDPVEEKIHTNAPKTYQDLRQKQLSMLSSMPNAPQIIAQGKRLEYEEHIIGAIAAVVEAIDLLQANMYKTSNATSDLPFAGGFALATSLTIQYATAEVEMANFNLIVSRPRRCWLLPRVIGNHKIAHYLLIVVQEEQTKDGSEFRVYFLDSSPEHLVPQHDAIFQDVINAAERVGWSTHRNQRRDSSLVNFGKRVMRPIVSKQSGNWNCGHHVILNAWILALGLTPSKTPLLTKDYVEVVHLITFALAGTLDWQTLVAWLFSKRATIENKVDDVPHDRRFKTTIRQTGDVQLGERLEAIVEGSDTMLESVYPSVSEYPYDHGNNIDFMKPHWDFHGKGLQRAHEDADMWELGSDDSEMIDAYDEDLDRSGLGFLIGMSDPDSNVRFL